MRFGFQIIAVALEVRIGLHRDHQKQIARCAAFIAPFTLPGHPHVRAGLHARRHFDLDLLAVLLQRVKVVPVYASLQTDVYRLFVIAAALRQALPRYVL